MSDFQLENAPTPNLYYVIHGGGWYYGDPAWVRAPTRYWYSPSHRVNYVGFRCARGAFQPLCASRVVCQTPPP